MMRFLAMLVLAGAMPANAEQALSDPDTIGGSSEWDVDESS
jgi:hypothetical protein